jgi:hypothetical protein
MQLDVPNLIVGFLVGAAVIAGLSFPRVGRVMARTLAIVLGAMGIGLLTWGLYAALGGEEFQAMELGPLVLMSTGQAIGWAAGCIAGATIALVLSFVGRN